MPKDFKFDGLSEIIKAFDKVLKVKWSPNLLKWSSEEWDRYGTLEEWKELGAFKMKSLIQNQLIDVTLSGTVRNAYG